MKSKYNCIAKYIWILSSLISPEDANNFNLFKSYIVTPKNTNKINQSSIRSNVEFKINKLITLKINPIIRKTDKYVLQDERSLSVLYPI